MKLTNDEVDLLLSALYEYGILIDPAENDYDAEELVDVRERCLDIIRLADRLYGYQAH